MKVAITRWGTRVSPLFDTAQQIALWELRGGEIAGRQDISIGYVPPPFRADFLAELGVGTLICGGISGFLHQQLLARGIQVIPWVTGEVEDVFRAYLHDRLHWKRFVMPGCRGCRHRFRGNAKRRSLLSSREY